MFWLFISYSIRTCSHRVPQRRVARFFLVQHTKKGKICQITSNSTTCVWAIYFDLGRFFSQKNAQPSKRFPLRNLKFLGNLGKKSLFGFDLFSSEKKIFKKIGHSFGR
jgi:hypothetical protein